MKLLFFVVTICSWAFVFAAEQFTPSVPCPGETRHSLEELRERIQVLPCSKKHCTMTRNTNTTVIFKFFADKEVKNLVNDVYATLGGIPVPFIGVHGTSACGHLVRADTGEPASCPLEPGHEYVFTRVFFIEPFFPAVSLRVHWSLNDGDDKIICFEVPGVISQGKRKKN